MTSTTPAPQASGGNTTQPPLFASASLYVGDLAADTTETELYDLFGSVGPVTSIRVCRDNMTRRSLGYSYVNFQNVADAERALATLNFTVVKSVPMRIMWSHRDPSLRKSGAGNIFVKNLDKTIDTKALYDTFSLFGNILSCKVEVDQEGKSRGFGFVHYESEEAATNAIERVNNMQIGKKPVYVCKFQKRGERQEPNRFTNLYIKHIPESWTDEKLLEIFSAFGEVTSHVTNKDAKSRCFAFVNYDKSESAIEAVKYLHGRLTKDDIVVDGPEGIPSQEEMALLQSCASPKNSSDVAPRLYVQRAQTKGERHAMFRHGLGRDSEATANRNSVNLYVKNLTDTMDDDALKELFEGFGTITSAKVMQSEAGNSRGFGFVCFTCSSEASVALRAMHLKLHLGKPLYVQLAEGREARTQRLQAQAQATAATGGGAGGTGGGPRPSMNGGQRGGYMMMHSNSQNYYNGSSGGGGGAVGYYHPSGGMMHQGGRNTTIGGGFSSWGQVHHPGGGGYGGGPRGLSRSYNPMAHHYQANQGGAFGPPLGGPAGGPGHAVGGGPGATGGGRGHHLPHDRMARGPMNKGLKAHHPPFKFTSQARNHMEGSEGNPANSQAAGAEVAAGTAPPNAPPPETDSVPEDFHEAPASIQKQILGEKLFPRISHLQPEYAGKITGMMLEMENHELVQLLDSKPLLLAKVNEAMRVLSSA